MSSCAHIGCLVLLVLVPAATGYGTGAPTKACVDMAPEHRNTNPQTSISPYTLELEDGGAMSDTMRVCITGTSFRGILLQMRKVGGSDPVGTFDGAMMPNDTKLLKCTADGDSVTHENTDVKPNSTCFVWKIHDKKNTEKLNFVATIAESREKYWVKVTSDVINVSDGEAAPANGTTTPADSATTPADSATTPADAATDPGLMFATVSLCSLLALVTGLVE